MIVIWILNIGRPSQKLKLEMKMFVSILSGCLQINAPYRVLLLKIVTEMSALLQQATILHAKWGHSRVNIAHFPEAWA